MSSTMAKPETPMSTEPATKNPRAKMVARDVSVFYGKHQVIRGVSLDIEQGEFLAIAGR